MLICTALHLRFVVHSSNIRKHMVSSTTLDLFKTFNKKAKNNISGKLLFKGGWQETFVHTKYILLIVLKKHKKIKKTIISINIVLTYLRCFVFFRTRTFT